MSGKKRYETLSVTFQCDSKTKDMLTSLARATNQPVASIFTHLTDFLLENESIDGFVSYFIEEQKKQLDEVEKSIIQLRNPVDVGEIEQASFPQKHDEAVPIDRGTYFQCSGCGWRGKKGKKYVGSNGVSQDFASKPAVRIHITAMKHFEKQRGWMRG